VALKVIAEMTGGGVDRAVECTGSIQASISAFECTHDVFSKPRAIILVSSYISMKLIL